MATTEKTASELRSGMEIMVNRRRVKVSSARPDHKHSDRIRVIGSYAKGIRRVSVEFLMKPDAPVRLARKE